MAVPENQKVLMDQLQDFITSCDAEGAVEQAKKVLESGIDPVLALRTVLGNSAQIVGEKFDSGEYFLPHLVMAGEAMTEVSKVFEKALPKESVSNKKTVVIATVEADMHSVGKNLVGMMLKSSGFEIYDLGVDVKSSAIIAKAQEVNANFIALSSLLTTTMPYQREVIEELQAMGLRDKFKVIVGGGPVREDWAREIGADGYAKDAIEAVKVFSKIAEE